MPSLLKLDNSELSISIEFLFLISLDCMMLIVASACVTGFDKNNGKTCNYFKNLTVFLKTNGKFYIY